MQETYDMHIQIYPDKRHLIYRNKTFCTTSLKFQAQFQMATTLYIYILFV